MQGLAIGNNLYMRNSKDSIDRLSFDLAKACSEHNFKVEYICRGTTPLMRRFEREGYNITELPSTPGWMPHKKSGWVLKNLFRPLRNNISRQFKRVIKSKDIKIFHGFELPEPHKIWTMLKANKVYNIQTISSTRMLEHKQFKLIKKASSNVSAVIFCSEELEEKYMKAGFFKNVKTKTVISLNSGLDEYIKLYHNYLQT